MLQSRWAMALAGTLAVATLPASLATGAEAALPASGSGAFDGTRSSFAQVQPRLISAPSSQWAVLETSPESLYFGQAAVLGSGTLTFLDDTVYVPSMSGPPYPPSTPQTCNAAGSQPQWTIFSPTLSTSMSRIVARNCNTIDPWTAVQRDDTVWMTTEPGYNAPGVATGLIVRTSGTPGGLDDTYVNVNRSLQGIVAVDDTIYIASQANESGDGKLLSVDARNPAISVSIATFSQLTPMQMAKTTDDDTLFVTNWFGNCNSQATFPATTTSQTLALGWCTYGAAGGDDSVYLGRYQGSQVAILDPRNVNVSSIVTVPGGGQFNGMDAWANTGDDTVFVTDGSKDTLWMLNGRSLSVDDSVVFDDQAVGCGDCGVLYVTAARNDLVYATVAVGRPNWWNRGVSAIGVVSGQTAPTSSGVTPLTGMPDDSITINLALPELFTQDDSLVTNVWLDDSVTTKAALVRNGNTITAKVPAGTGGPYSILVGLNGGNRIKVGEFTYGATVTFNANGGAGTMNPQTSTVAANLTPNAFVRSGYLFAGWNTVAGGTGGTAYADQASYPFTSNVTLYAQWSVIPPRPPRPIPTPTPTPSPSPTLTPDPTPTPVPVPTPLAPGDSELTIDGVPRPVAVIPNAGDNGLDIQGDGWTMDLDGLGPNGAPLNLGPDGVLRVQVGRDVQTEGTGFKPESDVGLFLNPPPVQTTTQAAGATWFRSYLARIASGTSIGMVRVDAQGDFLGTATLPRDIKPGTHVLQAVGFGPSGDTRALSLGVLVEPSLVLDQGVRIKGKGRIHDRINTTGSSTGIEEGTRLTPYIRYTGQKNFTKGKATIVVAADGTFRWTRQIRRDKGVTGYVAYRDLASNQVTWVKLS